MKIITKEEEDAHYQATVRGGTLGGVVGLGIGAGAVWYASKRFPGFRSLTIPLRTFFAISPGTFCAIIGADRGGNAYEIHRNKARQALSQHVSEAEQYEKSKPLAQRSKDWAAENRYSIVFASWVASMGIALQAVRKDKYLTGAQKLVQARVYAQGLTIAVLLASFAIETSDAARKRGRWETIKVLDPTDPAHKRLIDKRIHHERYEGEDQWMEVIAAEEERMQERKATHDAEVKTIHDAEERATKLGKPKKSA